MWRHAQHTSAANPCHHTAEQALREGLNRLCCISQQVLHLQRMVAQAPLQITQWRLLMPFLPFSTLRLALLRLHA
jgi:hypothetical protein